MAAFTSQVILIYWTSLWAAFWAFQAQAPVPPAPPLTVEISFHGDPATPNLLSWRANGVMQAVPTNCPLTIEMSLIQDLGGDFGEMTVSTTTELSTTSGNQLRYDSPQILLERLPIKGEVYLTRSVITYKEPEKKAVTLEAKSRKLTW